MKIVLKLAGVALTVFFIIVAFWQVKWNTFLSALHAIQPAYVVIGASALLASMVLRSIRWHLVTGLPRCCLGKVWEASCAGYLGIIYPARAGEVLRIVRLQRLTGLGGGLAIGTSVIDRILDGLGLCAMLLIFICWSQQSLVGGRGLFSIALIFVAAAITMAVYIVSGHRLRTLFQHFSSRGKIGMRLYHWYEQSLSGLQVLRSPRQLLLAVLCQAGVSMADVFACWLLLHAFGWWLPLMTSVIFIVYLTAVLCLPSTPGFVGMYQAAALFALRPYGVDASSAVAYGTVLQIMTLLLFIGAGLWALYKQKYRDQGLRNAT